MAIKYREAVDLRIATRQEITSSSKNWLTFLRTASNTYKYNFSDQLLIFAQFPNAKAVAVFDVWSKTFGRKIREGEKGIGLIDDKREYPRIKYVFDISQSSPTHPKKQQPYIWELTEENHQEVAFLLSSDKNKSIENVLSDTVENTVNEMIDDYINDLLNEDNSIEPEKFRQLVCDSVKYMALQRCGLDTSSYIDGDIFSSLNEFSNPDVIDILGESISNISEQALRKVEQTVKTIERRNQNERNNAQNKNDRWSRTSSVRIEHDILSDDNSGQDNWSKLHTRPRNIHLSSSSEHGGGYEGRGSLGSASPQVSQGEQEKNIDKANRHIQTNRPLDRNQRSSGETDGTARSGNDGSRGSNGRTQSNRPNEVGTNDELNQSKSRGNSSEQSDIRITQEDTVTQTAEDNSPAVFSFEQLVFFDSKVSEQQSEIDKFVNTVLMKGTGTEGGKFRVNDFFSENHTEEEKIDFLKEEFGWYGRYTSNESLESQPSKGLTLTHTDKENPKNNLNVHLSWKEVVEYLDSMVSGKTYITEKDIAERQRHALYVLKNYSSDNPNDVYAIQEAKKILDSYNIDYNDIISTKTSEKSVLSSLSVNENIVEEKYTSTQSEEKETIQIKPENYHISDLSLGQRKPLEKYQDNITAIKTLKQLEAENRNATLEEQEILSKYTGWGGMAKVFELGNSHYDEVKGLLTNDEYAAARKSAMSAFYTSPVIIKEIYSKLSDMGFSKGKLLEPSCGIGNFIGMIPQDMQTRITGIELDSLTGRIAKKLYPEAQIQICGFENSNLKSESFDVAVGNVPFGDIRIYDKKYNKENLLIHDYFFSKSLDMVKPGGVVAFITSKGTLDKRNDTARRLLAEKAEFLGAVRLPNNAFKANAGTDVTSDIIFLQKRTEPITIASENEPLWIKTTKDENGIEMNTYFTQNPQQICGSMEMVSGQFGMESTCMPNRDTKLSEQIRNAMGNIQGNISTKDTKLDNVNFVDEQVEIPDSLRTGSYFLSSDKVYFFEYGTATEVKLPKSNRKQNFEKMAGLIAIRDTVRQLLEMQLDDKVTDNEIKDVQSILSSLYDDFSSKYGRINDDVNKSIFKNDSSLPLLCSLEKFDKDKYIGKADIFTKRTVKANKEITSVPTAIDALAVSLIDTAKVNLEYMSKLTGFDKEKLIEDLQGSIYRVPNTDKYVTADEYLSGNILKKLEEAQNAFDKGDSSLAINIQALKKAMPKKIQASDIDVRLGATWIKPEYIRDFIYELLGTPSWHKNPYSQAQFIDVQYSDITGKWFITNKGTDKTNVQGRTTYGTADKTAYELIEDALNLKATTVKVKQIVDGKEKYVVDSTKTAQVMVKQDLILQKFKEWIFSDKTRCDDLVDTYNTIFNSTRPREYDGSHLNFVGMNPEIQLRPHQLNAVARCIYGGNTLLAHEVGAGKTFEIIATAMEIKRLGLHTKSLICAPKHLTEQIGSDFLRLYPNANILVATKKDFEKDKRKALMAKIATGNYDAIIIGHSQLEKIPLSQERQQQFIEYQIEETIRNIEELKAMNGERYQIKQAERTKANLEAKLKKLLDSPKDDTVTFEELGIDKMFLDEAHLFKNLFLSTKMQNVSGISTSSDVQKTADLFMKTQYLDELTGGKGIVFATGTPLSNTMCEIYNMMRYLQMDLLRNKHLEHFDSWASTFGENVTQMELTPEGNSYRAKTRFSKFYNLPELMAMFKECADIQTADTLNLPGIPECEVHNVAVEPSDVQKELVDTLSKRAEAIHNRQVDPSTDNMLKITTDGRKIGLDQRLINPDLPDEPNSKVNTCIENVFNIWGKTADTRGTQLIFCDYSTPKNDGSFNVYDDIKTKLIAKGIPENQIAFIHDATNEVKREELFAKVRSGEVRVLIGSTAKMGAGTNVQDRLVASHDLDAPYRPADMEQRRGRMVRQGNKNSHVHLYRYCTKDTFDAYLFQMLERKQSFISQIMTSKSPQRRCDDIDEATLSYAEVKALCVGDPRIKEKMELDNEVAKLILEKSGYQQEQYRLEDMAASLTSKISNLENIIPKNQNDFLYYHKNHFVSDGDKKIFAGISINGQQYTKKDEAAEALKQAYIKACSDGNNKYTPIGEYKGFEVAVMFDCFSREYKASLTREGTYYLDLGTDNFTRMDNVLEKLEDICKERIERLSEHKKSLKETMEQIGKPFYKEDEYQSKTAKLAKLNAELDVDGRKDNTADIEDTKEVSQNIVQKR